MKTKTDKKAEQKMVVLSHEEMKKTNGGLIQGPVRWEPSPTFPIWEDEKFF
jgi:hypothetical protein